MWAILSAHTTRMSKGVFRFISSCTCTTHNVKVVCFGIAISASYSDHCFCKHVHAGVNCTVDGKSFYPDNASVLHFVCVRFMISILCSRCTNR